MSTRVTESLTWTAIGLVLEIRCATKETLRVTVRLSADAGVLWDGDFIALGRTLDDLPSDDFTIEVLARVARDQADRLGRLVYAQDDLQAALCGIAAAIPEPYRS